MAASQAGAPHRPKDRLEVVEGEAAAWVVWAGLMAAAAVPQVAGEGLVAEVACLVGEVAVEGSPRRHCHYP